MVRFVLLRYAITKRSTPNLPQMAALYFWSDMRSILFFIVFSVSFLTEASNNMDVEKLFEKELINFDIEFKKIEPKLYEVSTESGKKIIALHNIEKNLIRDDDEGVVTRFVKNILTPIAELPEWNEMRNGLYISLEPSDYQGLEDVIHNKVGDTVALILAYFNPDVNQIRWIKEENLNERGIELENAWEIAQSNLETIMQKTEISFTEIEGEKLAMLEVDEPHKASLILTNALKAKVSKELGWPVFAVAPARDFVYLFSKQGSLINKVGHVVIREFNNSGYPISTDVWELSDGEQKIVGAYATK